MERELIRWLVLIVVLGNVLFNAFYSQLFDLPAINVISDKYNAPFTPAGYTFSIWGVIYLGLIIYSIYQLLPAREDIKLYDRLAPWVIANNILGSLWIFLFVNEILWASVIVIAIMLYTAYMLSLISSDIVDEKDEKDFIIIPFGILLGWLTAATIANLSLYLTSIGQTWFTIAPIYRICLFLYIIMFLIPNNKTKFNNIVSVLAFTWALVGAIVADSEKSGGEIKYGFLFILIPMLFIGIIVVRSVVKKKNNLFGRRKKLGE